MPTRGLINPELLTDIADAIRAKNGTSAGMTPAQMAEAISNLELSEAIKQALLNCFAHVAWIDDQGQTYYDALEDALYPTAPPAELLSISAVFEQGQTVIYDTDSLDDLKPMLTVTAHYSDSTSAVVVGYTLSGTLTAGTSTITVSYGGKTTTFGVVVTQAPLLPTEYQQVEWIANSAKSYILAHDPDFRLPSSFRIEAKTQLQGYNTSATYGNIAAVFQPNASSYGMEFAYKKEDNTIVFFAGAQSIVTPTSISDILVVGGIISETTAKCYIDVNGTRTYGSSVAVSRDYTTQRLGIFYGGDSDASVNQFVGKIYYVEIYDSNDELIANYIPCYRKSDGEIGMYDLVSNGFYSNAGTGTFTKGPDV